jgi:hypothetical protein
MKQIQLHLPLNINSDSYSCHIILDVLTFTGEHNMCMSRSSVLHVIHLLIPVAPMHTHNTYCTQAISPSPGIQSLYPGKQTSDTATLFTPLLFCSGIYIQEM